MRIVHVTNACTPRSGGIRTTVHALGHGYRAAGHEFVLVVPGPHSGDEDLPWGRHPGGAEGPRVRRGRGSPGPAATASWRTCAGCEPCWTRLRRTSGVLHLTADGRDGTQSVDQVVDHLGELAAIGVDESIVSLRNVSEPDAFEPLAFEPLAEVVRQAALITPAGR